MKTVLVIDDEEKATWAFEQFLEDAGYRPLVASTAETGVALVRSERPDVVICDVRLPGMSGLDALRQIREIHPGASVIVMTAYGTAQTAIDAIQHGAFDYLTKPLDLGRLRALLKRVEQAQSVAGDAGPPKPDAAPDASDTAAELVGDSPSMQEVYKLIGMLTMNRVTVLIEGESGTGKEVVARAIHRNSPARDRPFMAVNCGALAESLLATELFGHERGAFTDAVRESQGKIEAAQDGTLLLDEIGATSPALQVKLLRALQEREFQRVGGTKTLPVRARIIAATNMPLEEAVMAGRFREDLYYRLKVVSINLPPLRERASDVPLLVEHFRTRVSRELERPAPSIDESAMAALARYSWPGNVRELENAIRRAAIFCRSEVILTEHLPPEVIEARSEARPGGYSAGARLATAVRAVAHVSSPGEVAPAIQTRVDRTLVEMALERTQGNQVQAAQWLGISRTTLRRRMEALGLEVPEEQD